MSAGFTVRTARWPNDAEALREIRHEVFVREQDVPPDLEWDGIDDTCAHALAHDAEGHAIGCGRLLPDGHIGRMAVRKTWRSRGVGRALLWHLIAIARANGHRHVVLNAQVHAMPFYAREGFAPEGDEFIDAGIAHRAMRMAL